MPVVKAPYVADPNSREEECKKRFSALKTIHDQAQQIPKTVPQHGFGGRIRIAGLYATTEHYYDQTIKVCGWARTVREGGKGAFYFVELNDGSAFGSLQVRIDNFSV